MKIIFGLGNPGAEYSGTRHNIGFEIVDKLKEGFSARRGPAVGWEFNKKFNAEISEGSYKLQATSYKLLLVKPQTFMNLSGETIRKILEFYKLTPDDILVIHDDLDIALGKFKIATDSTSAGHNGVQNIIETLSTQKFKRVRVGIQPDEPTAIGPSDFVLQKFSKEEREKIKKIEDPIMIEIEKFYK